MIAIKAGTLIDGTGNSPSVNAVVLVDGETITHVGGAGSVVIPPDARVIDASNKIVMPGMIDGHLHVRNQGGTVHAAASRLAGVTELLETTTLRSYAHAKLDLWAGFTTIADMSSPGYVGIALRDAINEGLWTGLVYHRRTYGRHPLPPGG